MQNPLRTTAFTWGERGPRNIGGRTRAMIIDKRDATGNTVFAASVSGGIFKTTNFLSDPPTWVPLDDKMLNLAVCALVQDDVNPNIMYAGTGEGWFNVDAVKGAGIFKSTNGGSTWNLLPSTSTYEYVQDMVIDRGGNVYASLRNLSSTARGVHRSSDGGATWTQVLGLPLPGFTTGRAADLEVATNGDLYATLGIFSRTMVMKSSFITNGANTGALTTWTEITPPHSNITQRGELAVSPSNPQRLYLLLQDSITQQVPTIYRSNDGGTAWTEHPAPGFLNNGESSQTWYNLIAAVDPANPDVAVIGGLHLGKTTDGASNWAQISNGSTIPSPTAVHVDQHMILYLGSSRLYVGNDGGIYFTPNADQAAPAFTAKNNGYNVTQFYACDYHPTNSNYFLAGAQDNNTQKFTTAGINTTISVSGGDGGFPHIDQSDGGTVQTSAASNNQFFRSLNSGTSFSFLGSVSSNSSGRFISPSDYDDAQNTLYASNNQSDYYVINNLGGTPTALTVNISTVMPANHQVSAVKVDPFATNTIWLGSSTWESDDATANVVPKIFKLSNANTSAPTVLVNSSLPVPSGAYISSIDIDPANANHILVTLSNYGVTSVLESTNGGTSFSSIEGNLPDMPVRWGIFMSPTAQLGTSITGGIMLATELGVWTTSQISGAGTAWVPNNTGLPNVRTDMLKYRLSDGLVAAATHGRGLFTTLIPGGSFVITGVPNTAITKDFIKYIYAGANSLQVVTGSLNTRTISIQLFDMKGSLLYKKDNRYQNTSIYLPALSKGAYVITITGDKKETYTGQFIIK
jgi:hypothetical protein